MRLWHDAVNFLQKLTNHALHPANGMIPKDPLGKCVYFYNNIYTCPTPAKELKLITDIKEIRLGQMHSTDGPYKTP